MHGVLLVHIWNYTTSKILIFRATQIKQDSIKKQADCSNNITKYQIKYREKCTDIGIVGDHVRSELKNLVGDIPAKMGDIAGDIGALQQALAYYQVLYTVLLSMIATKSPVPVALCRYKMSCYSQNYFHAS